MSASGALAGGLSFKTRLVSSLCRRENIVPERRLGERLPVGICRQAANLLAQPGKIESPAHDKIHTRHFLDAALRFSRNLNDIERRIKRIEPYQSHGQIVRNIALSQTFRCLPQAVALVRGQEFVETRCEGFDSGSEMLNGFRDVIFQIPIAQEPQGCARHQPFRVNQHVGLHRIRHFVVEGFDRLPEGYKVEYLAREQIGPHHVRSPGAGFLLHAVDKGAARPG